MNRKTRKLVEGFIFGYTITSAIAWNIALVCLFAYAALNPSDAHAYDEYNDYGFQNRDEYIEYERTMDFIEQYDREVYQREQDERLEGIEKQLKQLNECNRWPGRCR